MKFEKYIRDNLDKHTTEVDAAKIWDHVAKNIDQKKNRRGLFYWLSGLGLSLVAVSIFFLYSFFNDTNAKTYVNTEEQISSTNIETANDSQNPSLQQPVELVTNNSQEKINPNKNDNSLANNLESKNTTNNSPSAIVSSNVKTPPNNTRVKLPIIAKNTTPHFNTNSSLFTTPQIGKSKNQTKKNILLEEKQMNLGQSVPTPMNEALRIENLILIKTIFPSLFKWHREPLALREAQPLSSLVAADSDSHFSLSLFSGVGLSAKTLSSEDRMYTDLRNTTESTLEYYALSTGFLYHLNTRFAIGSGVDYLLQIEKFEWEGDYEESINGTYVDTIYYSKTLDTTITYANGDHEVLIHRNMRIYNRHQFISIPLSVQYSLGLGRHELSIRPSILFNLVRTAKGYYLNNFGVPSLLQELKTQGSIQYQLALDYHIPLSETWSFSVGSSLRWIPNSVLGENALLTQSSYKMYALRLGLSKTF